MYEALRIYILHSLDFGEKRYRYPYLFGFRKALKVPICLREGVAPSNLPCQEERKIILYNLGKADFAERLKALRKARGKTQEKSAEELNISLEHLGNIERGKGKPSLELLVEIALYFHVSTDYLLLGNELDKDSVRMNLIEMASHMMELASKL